MRGSRGRKDEANAGHCRKTVQRARPQRYQHLRRGARRTGNEPLVRGGAHAAEKNAQRAARQLFPERAPRAQPLPLRHGHRGRLAPAADCRPPRGLDARAQAQAQSRGRVRPFARPLLARGHRPRHVPRPTETEHREGRRGADDEGNPRDEYLQFRLCGLHGERGSRRLLRGTARGQRVRSGCQQDCRLLGLRLLRHAQANRPRARREISLRDQRGRRPAHHQYHQRPPRLGRPHRAHQRGAERHAQLRVQHALRRRDAQPGSAHGAGAGIQRARSAHRPFGTRRSAQTRYPRPRKRLSRGSRRGGAGVISPQRLLRGQFGGFLATPPAARRPLRSGAATPRGGEETLAFRGGMGRRQRLCGTARIRAGTSFLRPRRL